MGRPTAKSSPTTKQLLSASTTTAKKTCTPYNRSLTPTNNHLPNSFKTSVKTKTHIRINWFASIKLCWRIISNRFWTKQKHSHRRETASPKLNVEAKNSKEPPQHHLPAPSPSSNRRAWQTKLISCPGVPSRSPMNWKKCVTKRKTTKTIFIAPGSSHKASKRPNRIQSKSIKVQTWLCRNFSGKMWHPHIRVRSALKWDLSWQKSLVKRARKDQSLIRVSATWIKGCTPSQWPNETTESTNSHTEPNSKLNASKMQSQTSQSHRQMLKNVQIPSTDASIN